jgi:hypothetical protein
MKGSMMGIVRIRSGILQRWVIVVAMAVLAALVVTMGGEHQRQGRMRTWTRKRQGLLPAAPVYF